MKHLILLSLFIALACTGCKKEEKSTPAPASIPATTTMTALETSLLGQWKLKRSEGRSTAYLLGLGDSTVFYTNHYNLLNSQLELKANTSFVTSTGVQMYQGVMGLQDGTPASGLNWCGNNGNTISLDGTTSYFIVHYLTSDSLVLDWAGGQSRLFFNKSATAPALNNIESQLLGTWHLITHNGIAPTAFTYKTFLSGWCNANGYFSKDSTYLSYPPPGMSIVNSPQWEVLFSHRSIPILYNDGGYSKITSLSATSMTLESINAFANSTTINTDVYTR